MAYNSKNRSPTSRIFHQHLNVITKIRHQHRCCRTTTQNDPMAVSHQWLSYGMTHTFCVNLNCSWQFWSIFTSTGRSIWYVPSETWTINCVVGSKSRSKSIWSRFSSRCDSISPVIGFISSSSFSLISFDDLTLYRKFVSKSRDVSMGVTFWALSQGLIQSYSSWWVESQRAKRAKFAVPCVRRSYICLAQYGGAVKHLSYCGVWWCYVHGGGGGYMVWWWTSSFYY